jgi:hypothetical protein
MQPVAGRNDGIFGCRIWVPANCWGRAEGIADSTEEGLRYLTALGRGDLNRSAAGVARQPA